jgi:hypothetical protein
MPAYRYNSKPLVYFAGYKTYWVYATPTGHAEFAKCFQDTAGKGSCSSG